MMCIWYLPALSAIPEESLQTPLLSPEPNLAAVLFGSSVHQFDQFLSSPFVSFFQSKSLPSCVAASPVSFPCCRFGAGFSPRHATGSRQQSAWFSSLLPPTWHGSAPFLGLWTERKKAAPLGRKENAFSQRSILAPGSLSAAGRALLFLTLSLGCVMLLQPWACSPRDCSCWQCAQVGFGV